MKTLTGHPRQTTNVCVHCQLIFKTWPAYNEHMQQHRPISLEPMDYFLKKEILGKLEASLAAYLIG